MILFSPTYANLAQSFPEGQSREKDVVTTSVALRIAIDVVETVSIEKSKCCVLKKINHIIDLPTH